MSRNVVEFPDRNTVAKEAAEWLIRLDGDEAPSTGELDSLREWLARSPVHREQLNSLAVFWGKMNVLTGLAVPLEQANSRAAHARFFGPVKLRSRFVTAGVFGVAIIAAIAANVMMRPVPELNSNDYYATAVGQQRSVTLVDGSLVFLNTNTQIKVDYDDEYRNVLLLQGEAHFTVASNSIYPFRVYAGNGRVQAVGTAFSVYLKGTTVDVTVTEGEVALASIGQPRAGEMPEFDSMSGDARLSELTAAGNNYFVEAPSTIKAGETATIKSLPVPDAIQVINQIESIEAREMAKRMSWRDGMLSFAGDPLAEVVEEISRYTTISIEISDPVVRSMRIGGRFPIGETDAMFDALEANFGLRVKRLGRDRVLISAATE